MKISEIKSDEVRNEAVRLAIEAKGRCNNEEDVIRNNLIFAFNWESSPQKQDFWLDLHDGTTPNTPDLKLPEKNPSEAS
jgi:hypothetical protein